jgi:hypothetical protein
VTGTSRSRRVIESITRAAQEAGERQPKPVGAESAPGRKDRTWEDKHRTTPLRLRPDDAEWIRTFAERHGVTLDSAGRGLIRAMRYAVEKELVSFTKRQSIEPYTDKAGHQRNRAHVELQHRWQIPRS